MAGMGWQRCGVAAVVFAWTLVATWTAVASADERTTYLFQIAREYSEARRVQGPPGTAHPSIENLHFALWALRTGRPPRGGALTTAEWGFVLHQLHDEGFRFDYQLAPLTGKDLGNLVHALSDSDVNVRRGLHEHYREELGRSRRTFPVPFTEIILRPSIGNDQLPPFLVAVKPGDDGAATLVLNQGTGRLSRLPAVLEIVGQTEVGREALRELLPMLKARHLFVAPMTSAPARLRGNLREGHAAAALYSRSVHWDPEMGRYRIQATIYVDETAELGQLTEEFFHEARHATDPVLRESGVRAMVLLENAERLRRGGRDEAAAALATQAEQLLDRSNATTERFAFDGQMLFKEQLAVVFPQTRDYYYGKLQRGESHPPATPQFLAAAYGIRSPGCHALAELGR
jgi:hypothetical protein